MDSTAQFNDLPAHVWPRNAKRTADGGVEIADVALSDVAKRWGTPVMVVDEDDFRSRMRDMARAFGSAQAVHYASKAFLTRQIARWVDEEGLSLDVASENEYLIARAGGFPAERIAAHGNNKSAQFLRRLAEDGVGSVVLDSFTELQRLDAIAQEVGTVCDVLVRVKPGIEAHTHEFIATSHEDQKFGFSLASGSAFEAAEAVLKSSGLRLAGLHCHVGSQVFDAEGFSLAAQRVLGLLERLIEELGPTHPGGREGLAEQLSTLDLGGGYGIAYLPGETPLDVDEVAKDLLRRVNEQARQMGLTPPQVRVEPGRAIAGPSTITMYTVGTVKDVHVSDERTRRYLAIDGGMSDNIRPALYDAPYDVRVVNRAVGGAPTTTRIVGSHCEAGDILVNDMQAPNDICEGDLLALAATGAYCYAMSSRYNSFGRPAIVVVKDGEAQLMVRRETIEDILALEEPDMHI